MSRGRIHTLAGYTLAFLVGCAGATLLWAMRVKLDDPLCRTLSPVCASPWEMGKAAFFPLLAVSPLLWRWERGGSRGGLCCMALAGTVIAVVLTWWTPLPPAAVTAAALAGAVTLYGLVLRRLSDMAAVWGTAVVVMAVAYILLTLRHPMTRLFLPGDDVAVLAGIPF